MCGLFSRQDVKRGVVAEGSGDAVVPEHAHIADIEDVGVGALARLWRHGDGAVAAVLDDEDVVAAEGVLGAQVGAEAHGTAVGAIDACGCAVYVGKCVDKKVFDGLQIGQAYVPVGEICVAIGFDGVWTDEAVGTQAVGCGVVFGDVVGVDDVGGFKGEFVACRRL